MLGSEQPAVPPATLRAAATVVTLQAVCEMVSVAGRTELVVGLRISLMLVIGLQLVFAARLSRYSAGSVFGLFAFELMTLVAGAVSGGSLLIRGALALSSITVIALLGASLSAFPSPAPPRP